MGGVADAKIHALSLMCYHVKFGSFESKGLCITEGTSKIGERWDPVPLRRGVADHVKTSLLPICVTV